MQKDTGFSGKQSKSSPEVAGEEALSQLRHPKPHSGAFSPTPSEATSPVARTALQGPAAALSSRLRAGPCCWCRPAAPSPPVLPASASRRVCGEGAAPAPAPAPAPANERLRAPPGPCTPGISSAPRAHSAMQPRSRSLHCAHQAAPRVESRGHGRCQQQIAARPGLAWLCLFSFPGLHTLTFSLSGVCPSPASLPGHCNALVLPRCQLGPPPHVGPLSCSAHLPLPPRGSDLSSVTDEVFLEAQIQNITTSPMFMEKVSLEPSMMYSVAELNTVDTAGESESTFGSRTYLQPMDTRQYLYCLKPKQEFAEKAGVIKGVTVIGKLDIVWKTNLGERGRLQTSQLQRMAPGYGDVRLSLETIPDTVNLEEPFDITCKITNCSERTMDLVLEMCNTNSIHWCGVSGRQLGKLHPSSSLHLALTLLSSVQGLQSVSGLRLTDTFLKRTYEYDDIAQVCVVSSEV
ncbi:trafficking protein particle complex subunit 13-like [Indicator indicator]|uniref:trafficking protein particle complex subunit 13-like n=2 Tax=Indicator indicator TaxID=1002788 RepID=UPI0023DF45D6|nr:trafficking protein particle complex subunit 13-like [Indicator indicator]